MTTEEKKREVERIVSMGNQAKDRLDDMVMQLEELGCIRKAKSLKTLIYAIETWQNKP